MCGKISCGMVGGSLNAFIGEVHRKALRFDTRAELVAGCFSTSAEKNAATAQAYGIAADRLYADYREMAAKEAAREDPIDFVSIVTPNVSHYEIAKAFLEAGINVVCEKPLCLEVEQAEELQALAQRKGLLFAVTYTYAGYTMSRVMKKMIVEGKIGEITAVNAEYAQDWLLDQLSSTEDKKSGDLSIWRTDPACSGISNCVGDIGTHIENYVHYVTGLKIRRLLATANTFGHKLDLNANILLEYDNGANGAYWCSQIAAGHYNGLVVRIFGKLGALEWQQEKPDCLYYTPKGEATQVLVRSGSADTASRLPVGHPEGLYVAFANIYREYITALIDKKEGRPYSTELLTTAEDGVDGVKFIHAVIESAKKDSAWVTL